ncbi:hypothetical protein DRA42_11000 [Ethanoligenens harbinense]|nr:hypothetical protein CXQ68_10970 [Ethanoligenens harbinense YUAN-3]AYF39355.1 hypothetical protein CXP51_10860 [Ethanoligenens harbinense]AYF42180.1 hypothetical protein CN246_11410 [Ethanoligenens harbinense]QCN92935.1 hypothetical protein DRA42_11000 [Ethanoligenens harbinense]
MISAKPEQTAGNVRDLRLRLYRPYALQREAPFHRGRNHKSLRPLPKSCIMGYVQTNESGIILSKWSGNR